jgi:hypothetical protein
MRGHRFHAIALTALFVCALIAAGCGDDDDETTTTTAPAASAEQRVHDAVQSCSAQAQQLGGLAGTALESACSSVGSTAQQALSTGGEKGKQALSQAESSCTSAVGGLPSGQAQAALLSLCDAISSAE